MSGSLTTEVIDLARGMAARGMLVDLFRLPHGVGERRHLKTVESNQQGGTDAPLLEGEDFAPATYELLFHVGRYFRALRLVSEETLFLDVIPVRFSVTDAEQSLRIVLLANPWAYSVYRT